MVSAKLCAVVGETTAFEAEIDEGESVSALKKTIKEANPASITCDAKNLKLYLTKKNLTDLEWLRTENQVRDGKTSADGFMLLNAGAALEDTGLSADQVKRTTAERVKAVHGEGPVHVLVEVPENTVGPAIAPPGFAQLAQEMHEVHAQAVLTKRKRYVHSKVGSTEGNALLNDLNIEVDPVRAGQFHNGNDSVKKYEWKRVVIENGQEIVLTEEQQRKRYRKYVKRNIGVVLVEKQLCVVGVEKGTNILTVAVPGREIDLSGRTDMLILSDIVRDDASDLQYLPDVKMLIEVKRHVTSSCDYRALSELIALDLLARGPVVAVLTDLQEDWRFFWVSEEIPGSPVTIKKAKIKNPSDAFQAIKTLLSGSNPEISLPYFAEPVKRQKLSRVLTPTREGGENGGVRESIERYYDIASMLGPDFDMARAVAREVTRSIPTLSYFS